MLDKHCASCGTPLSRRDDLGTNADGSKNENYCKYCLEGGSLTTETTLDELFEFSFPALDSDYQDDPNGEEDIERLLHFYKH